MKQKFLKFLEENDAKDKFFDNFDLEFANEYYDIDSIDVYFYICDEYCFLSDAFDWNSSNEGWDYWSELDVKWCKDE